MQLQQFTYIVHLFSGTSDRDPCKYLHTKTGIRAMREQSAGKRDVDVFLLRILKALSTSQIIETTCAICRAGESFLFTWKQIALSSLQLWYEKQQSVLCDLLSELPCQFFFSDGHCQWIGARKPKMSFTLKDCVGQIHSQPGQSMNYHCNNASEWPRETEFS